MPVTKKNGQRRQAARRKTKLARVKRMPTRTQIIGLLRREMPRLHEKYGVVRLGLYGSFAKGTAKKTSDIDLLVEFDKPLGWGYVAFADELEETLGRKVDVATFSNWRRSLTNPRRRAIAEDVERTLVYVQ